MIIDTGKPEFDPIDLIPDWFRDVNQSATAERMIHDYGYHLIGALGNPVKVETCRKHMMREWAFLRLLAETWPDVFDEYLIAYAERANGFE